MNNKNLRKKMSMNAYQTVKENYSWNKKLEGYEDLTTPFSAKNAENIHGGGYNCRVISKNNVRLAFIYHFKEMEAAA